MAGDATKSDVTAPLMTSSFGGHVLGGVPVAPSPEARPQQHVVWKKRWISHT